LPASHVSDAAWMLSLLQTLRMGEWQQMNEKEVATKCIQDIQKKHKDKKVIKWLKVHTCIIWQRSGEDDPLCMQQGLCYHHVQVGHDSICWSTHLKYLKCSFKHRSTSPYLSIGPFLSLNPLHCVIPIIGSHPPEREIAFTVSCPSFILHYCHKAMGKVQLC